MICPTSPVWVLGEVLRFVGLVLLAVALGVACKRIRRLEAQVLELRAHQVVRLAIEVMAPPKKRAPKDEPS